MDPDFLLDDRVAVGPYHLHHYTVSWNKFQTINFQDASMMMIFFFLTRKPSTPWWTGATSEACSVTGHQKADPTNCGVYYRCVLGQYRRELCSPGLHWDSKRKICNWPYSANCQSRVTDGEYSLNVCILYIIHTV